MTRTRWPLCALASFVVAGAVTLASPGSASAATWQVTPAQAEVIPDSATDAWGIFVNVDTYGGDGSTTEVANLSGTTWSFSTVPGLPEGAAIAGDSPTDAWAVWDSTAAHYDGSSWTTSTIPAAYGLNSVAIVSPADVWAAGPNHTNPAGLPLVHWNGTQWSSVAPPAPPGATWVSVNALSASGGDLWVLASASLNCSNGFCDNEYFAARWDGTGWSPTPALPAGFTAGSSISADSAADVWVVGGGTGDAAHYNGSTWSTFTMPATSGQTALSLHKIAAHGGQAWAVGSTQNNGTTHAAVYHWDGSAWSSAAFPVTSDYSDTSSVTYLPGSNTVWIEALDPTTIDPTTGSDLVIAVGG